MIGAIYFCSILLPCSPASRKHRKYEVAVYSFLSAILLLSYGVHWNLLCRRFQPETTVFLPAYHIQCYHFPYKKVPLSCASATVHNVRYTCQVLPLKRYRKIFFKTGKQFFLASSIKFNAMDIFHVCSPAHLRFCICFMD